MKSTMLPNADADGWLTVPAGWSEGRCPSNWNEGTEIEVEFRDGSQGSGKIFEFTEMSWVQEGCDFDIVQYRII